MIIARYIISLALLLLAGYIVGLNWCCVIVSMRNTRRGIQRHHSTVPLISLVVTVLALLFYPHPNKAAWMLAVPALDIAHLNLFFFVLLSPLLLIRQLRTKKNPKADAQDAHN